MNTGPLNERTLRNAIPHSGGKGFDPHAVYSFRRWAARRVAVAGPPAYKPSMVQRTDGDILVSYTTIGAAPGDRRRGAIEVIRSSDGGDTWDAPVCAVGPEYTAMDHAMIPFPDGTLLMSFMRIVSDQPRTPWQGPNLCMSTDGGRTWGEPWPVDVSDICPNGPFVTGDRSHVVLADGTLFFFVGTYDPPERPYNYMLVSRDRGRTFPERRLVSRFSGDSTFVLCRDGSIAGALRINADEFPEPGAGRHLVEEGECVHFMGFTRSEDRGVTWSDPYPVTGFNEIPAHLIELQDGRLLLTYGSRHVPVGVRAVLTAADGRTWDLDNPIMLAWHGVTSFADGRAGGKNTIGHPYTIQRPDGSLFTVYYYCADPLAVDQWQIEGVSWRLCDRGSALVA